MRVRIMDRNQVRALKEPFATQYSRRLRASGFFMSTGLGSDDHGNTRLEVRLLPLPGTIPEQTAIEAALQSLPKNYRGTSVNILYNGTIVAQEDVQRPELRP